ncbi:pentapeptide repeat-containing protein [Thiolapillus sp.]
MSISTNRHWRFMITLVLTIGGISTAHAWTEEVDKLKDINTLCKLEPDAQCSWTVRIGLQAPGVDMNNASMASMRLDDANLQRANLSYAILQLASFKGANLMLANMQGAHLHGVNFQGANLTMANMMDTNLLDADLSGANLRGANLSGAILIKAKFDNAIWTDGRRCAAGSIGECR